MLFLAASRCDVCHAQPKLDRVSKTECRCKLAFNNCRLLFLLDFSERLDVLPSKDLTNIHSLTLVHHAEFCRYKLPQNVIISNHD